MEGLDSGYRLPDGYERFDGRLESDKDRPPVHVTDFPEYFPRDGDQQGGNNSADGSAEKITEFIFNEIEHAISMALGWLCCLVYLGYVF